MLVNGTGVLVDASLNVNVRPSMFDRFFGRKPEPLTGAPQVRRIKSYSAASGYAYQYCYLGRRAAQRREGRGTEYVFDVSGGREPYHPVSVFLLDASAASWEARKGRALIPAERYAIAKMSLLQAFDERSSPRLMTSGVLVRAADVDAIIDVLGIE
ncbi:MAG TPA: hypothetical protein VN442_24060 [Bryobacteraceae bacterium]|nr:hypothetical protein [Bryobacteraceae bacterium]